MILKSFKMAVSTIFSPSTGALSAFKVYDVSSKAEREIYIGGSAGSYSAFNGNPGYYMIQPQSKKAIGSTAPGVYFGDGDAAPTEDDIALAGNYFTTFSCATSSLKVGDDNGFTVQVTYTLTNTGSSSFTIREIGLVIPMRKSSSGSMYTFVDRTVLDTPVTIEPGGVGQVTYTIRQEW